MIRGISGSHLDCFLSKHCSTVDGKRLNMCQNAPQKDVRPSIVISLRHNESDNYTNPRIPLRSGNRRRVKHTTVQCDTSTEEIQSQYLLSRSAPTNTSISRLISLRSAPFLLTIIFPVAAWRTISAFSSRTYIGGTRRARGFLIGSGNNFSRQVEP